MVTLLYGDETFLRDRRLRELVEAMTPLENPDYNVDQLQGPDIDLAELVGSCDTLPVFGSTRLVIARDLDLSQAGAHARFMTYLGNPNPTTRLLITSAPTSSKRGGRSGGSDINKFLAKIPAREEFSPLRAERATQFVREAARARGVAIAGDAVALLVELVGVDAGRLDSEVEKVALYTGGRRVESADVEILAWRTRTHTMFELTDAIACADRSGVLRHLGALFEDGNEPLAILGMFGWHLRRSLRAAALVEEGRTSAQVASAIGLNRGIAERFTETSRRLGTLGAARALIALRAADFRIKSTPEDKRQIVERTLLASLPSR